jgi:hypothetical protein
VRIKEESVLPKLTMNCLTYFLSGNLLDSTGSQFTIFDEEDGRQSSEEM